MYKSSKVADDQTPSCDQAGKSVPNLVHRKTRFNANALVILTTAPYFRFAKIGAPKLRHLRQLIGTDCDSVETLPVKENICELEWTLYADGVGMMKGLPMNTNMNPLMHAHDIIYYADMSGPYGNLVLCTEKGALSWQVLYKLFKAQDEQDAANGEGQDDDDMRWVNLLEKAKNVYETENVKN